MPNDQTLTNEELTRKILLVDLDQKKSHGKSPPASER